MPHPPISEETFGKRFAVACADGGRQMGIPEGSFAVAALVVLALPGLIYSAIRRWLRGERAEDRDIALGFARGSVFAIVLTSVYALILGGALFSGISVGAEDTVSISEPRWVALGVLVLYVLVPFGLALILRRHDIDWAPIWKGGPRIRPRSRYGYRITPTAWDHAVVANEHTWIKIRKKDGSWIGGWYSGQSYATAYPEPASIYIDKQFAMSQDGNFENEIPGAGVWMTVGAEDIVIWQKP